MWKTLIAASALLSTSCCIASQFERFLATISTVTTTSFLTSWDTCTFSTSCATFPTSATACRRRRVDRVISDQVQPSEPVRLVQSTLAVVKCNQYENQPPTLEGSVEDVVHLDIRGFPEACASYLPRNFVNLITGFGITVFVTSTVTSSTTCLFSTTKTNTFSIAGCSPNEIVTCTTSG